MQTERHLGERKLGGLGLHQQHQEGPLPGSSASQLLPLSAIGVACSCSTSCSSSSSPAAADEPSEDWGASEGLIESPTAAAAAAAAHSGCYCCLGRGCSSCSSNSCSSSSCSSSSSIPDYKWLDGKPSRATRSCPKEADEFDCSSTVCSTASRPEGPGDLPPPPKTYEADGSSSNSPRSEGATEHCRFTLLLKAAANAALTFSYSASGSNSNNSNESSSSGTNTSDSSSGLPLCVAAPTGQQQQQQNISASGQSRGPPDAGTQVPPTGPSLTSGPQGAPASVDGMRHVRGSFTTRDSPAAAAATAAAAAAHELQQQRLLLLAGEETNSSSPRKTAKRCSSCSSSRSSTREQQQQQQLTSGSSSSSSSVAATAAEPATAAPAAAAARGTTSGSLSPAAAAGGPLARWSPPGAPSGEPRLCYCLEHLLAGLWGSPCLCGALPPSGLWGPGGYGAEGHLVNPQHELEVLLQQGAPETATAAADAGVGPLLSLEGIHAPDNEEKRQDVSNTQRDVPAAFRGWELAMRPLAFCLSLSLSPFVVRSLYGVWRFCRLLSQTFAVVCNSFVLPSSSSLHPTAIWLFPLGGIDGRGLAGGLAFRV